MEQADINTKDRVSHSNCITRHIIGPNFDDQIVPITSYEVNKSIRHMIWGVLLMYFHYVTCNKAILYI